MKRSPRVLALAFLVGALLATTAKELTPPLPFRVSLQGGPSPKRRGIRKNPTSIFPSRGGKNPPSPKRRGEGEVILFLKLKTPP